MGILKSAGDKKVYGSLQAMFNAKPDLVVCYGNQLIVYEAKYTMGFKKDQMAMTGQIAEVWAGLLYEDLEFDAPSEYSVRTLGLDKYSPDVSWERVYAIARKYWDEGDFSLRVLSKVGY
jgi:hypothetical protein